MLTQYTGCAITGILIIIIIISDPKGILVKKRDELDRKIGKNNGSHLWGLVAWELAIYSYVYASVIK